MLLELSEVVTRNNYVTRGVRGRKAQLRLVGGAAALLFVTPLIGLSIGDARGAAPVRSGLTTPVEGDANPAAPQPAPAPRPQLAHDAVVAAERAAAPSTELAVAVLDRGTGELAVGALGTEPFYAASLAKVVVAVDVLDRRRLEGLALTDPDIALLRRALSASDDSAMNALWTRFNGVGAAARLSARLGLTATSAPQDPSQWGEMTMSAADAVRLWRYIIDGMPATDRDLLVSAMGGAPTTAADGFDQAFGLLSPEVDGVGGQGVVAKQAWMCCFSSRYYLHSAGTVDDEHRFLVALLTRQPRGPGWAVARAELDRIAFATLDAIR